MNDPTQDPFDTLLRNSLAARPETRASINLADRVMATARAERRAAVPTARARRPIDWVLSACAAVATIAVLALGAVRLLAIQSAASADVESVASSTSSSGETRTIHRTWMPSLSESFMGLY